MRTDRDAVAPLAQGTIDVWSAALDSPTPTVSELAACLSVEERVRAARFVSARDGDRFVVGRAFLRRLLARYAGVRAEALSLGEGAHGKPALDGGSVAFNLAHSGELAVCAIAPGGTHVGVDIERLTPLSDVHGVARMILSARERECVVSLPAPQQTRRLFEIWTCKEAVLKALGSGLDRPLDRIEVVFPPGEQPRLAEPANAKDERPPISLRAFEPAAGFVGTVAVVGGVTEVRHQAWHW